MAFGNALEIDASHLKSLNSADRPMPGLKATNSNQRKFALSFEQPHLCVIYGELLVTVFTLDDPVWTL